MQEAMVYTIYNDRGVYVMSHWDEHMANIISMEIGGYVVSDVVEYDEDAPIVDRIVYSTENNIFDNEGLCGDERDYSQYDMDYSDYPTFEESDDVDDARGYDPELGEWF